MIGEDLDVDHRRAEHRSLQITEMLPLDDVRIEVDTEAADEPLDVEDELDDDVEEDDDDDEEEEEEDDDDEVLEEELDEEELEEEVEEEELELEVDVEDEAPGTRTI